MTSAASGAHEKLSFNTVNITQGGYVYVYLSNEGQTGFDVYFDDLNITHTKGAILQEDHYYPFGMNINALSSTAPLSKPNQFKYNGKELNEEFGLDWYDYQARNYDPQLGRWHSIDPLGEKYLSFSPYNYAVNNPILFVDPDGNEIKFYMWYKAGYDDFGEIDKIKEVAFNELDENVQKALGAFAKTEAGKAYLSQFAKAGDKVGDVEFTKDGKFSKHEVGFQQFDTEGSAYGTSGFGQRNGKVSFFMKINESRSDKTPEAYAITAGHEAFIHLSQYDERLIKAIENNDYEAYKKIAAERSAITRDRNGGPEHDGYMESKPEYSRMKGYLNQLKNVLNPAEVNKQIQKHDSKYKKGK